MPRPSKHVSPDTLGGRIRAARKSLHLSLAEVADGHYSTSLLSQIERNRIDPSPESLRYLAGRLQLPLDDLDILAQQNRGRTSSEPRVLAPYESLFLEATNLFKAQEVSSALELLVDLNFPQVPSEVRWRLAALRGECHFAHRRFLKAEQDFAYAIREQPQGDALLEEHHHQFMLLHLHMAGTYRELQMLEEALEQYHHTLRMMNCDTPSGYVAEAHWGLALINFAQANKLGQSNHGSKLWRESTLRLSLEHAENARFLYRSISEHLLAATVTCQIARIEQALGNREKARVYLKEVITNWADVLNQQSATSGADKRIQQKEANIVSVAACTLASIELEEGHYTQAHTWVEYALQAGKRSYKLRRADAYLMLGRVLEYIDPKDSAIEEALRNATEELVDTDRIAMRISAHAHLGRYLLKAGRISEGERELEQARLLSDIVSIGDTSSAEDAALS